MAKKLSGDIRREQIADAALIISAKKGVRAVTVAAVAEQVGIAPSAVYRHVDGREGILKAAMDLLTERMLASLTQARKLHENPLDAIEMFLEGIIEHVLAGRASPRVIFSDEIFSSPETGSSSCLKFLKAIQEELVSLIVGGQRDGYIRTDIQARRIGLMIVGVYSPSIILYHATQGEFDIKDQISIGWKMFRQALDPKNGEEGNFDGMVADAFVPAT